MNALRKNGFINNERCMLIPPRKASLDEIKLVHSEEYIDLVKEISERGGGYLDPDTPLSKESFEVALLAAGGILKICEKVLSREVRNGFGLVRPPGHHAGFKGRALSAPTAGFCVFNNVAIAAANLIRKQNFRKILILDLDCHHGNGTQEIFYSSSDVLFISLHQDPLTIYPGTGFIEEKGVGEGEGFNINIPLPPGSSDDIYIEFLDEVVMPVVKEFKPEFVLISAGFDAYKGDPITSMNLSSYGYSYAFLKALEIASISSAGRLVASLEGGYGEGLSRALVTVMSVLTGVSSPLKDKRTKSDPYVIGKARKVLEEIKKAFRDYWPL